MRLDKFLCMRNFGSRKSCKKFVRNNEVIINGKRILDGEYQIKGEDEIFVNGKRVFNNPLTTIMLNKPEGYICSMQDENYPSVMNLIPKEYPNTIRMVGRLDQDTTGLLLLTDNGVLNSRLASPKHQIEKKYKVCVNHILRPTLVDLLNNNIDIGRGEIAKPSKLEIIDDYNCYLTVSEGKYHEVKRLFGHFNYDVIKLERVKFGPIELSALPLGKCRALTDEETKELLKAVKIKEEEVL